MTNEELKVEIARLDAETTALTTALFAAVAACGTDFTAEFRTRLALQITPTIVEKQPTPAFAAAMSRLLKTCDRLLLETPRPPDA